MVDGLGSCRAMLPSLVWYIPRRRRIGRCPDSWTWCSADICMALVAHAGALDSLTAPWPSSPLPPHRPRRYRALHRWNRQPCAGPARRRGAGRPTFRPSPTHLVPPPYPPQPRAPLAPAHGDLACTGWLHCNLQNSPAAACLHCARGAVLTSARARAEDSGGATGAVSSRRGLLRRTLRLGTAHVWAAHTARRRATSNSTG